MLHFACGAGHSGEGQWTAPNNTASWRIYRVLHEYHLSGYMVKLHSLPVVSLSGSSLLMPRC